MKDDFLISDEMLGAYLDGELDRRQTAAVEAALADDRQLALKVQGLRDLQNLLGQAFEAPMHKPAPRRLLDLLPEASSRPDNVVALPTSHHPRPRHRWHLPIAIAASLIAGWVTSSQLMAPTVRSEDGVIMVAGPLCEALDWLPSGRSIEVAEFGAVQPISTFASVDGRWCRRARATSQEGSFDFVACVAKPDWSVEAIVALDSGDRRRALTRPRLATVDAVVAQLSAGAPLDRRSEARVIAGGWSQKDLPGSH